MAETSTVRDGYRKARIRRELRLHRHKHGLLPGETLPTFEALPKRREVFNLRNRHVLLRSPELAPGQDIRIFTPSISFNSRHGFGATAVVIKRVRADWYVVFVPQNGA